VRKVSVGLEADVAAFIRPVLESVEATERLDDKVKSLDRSLNKIPADAAKAGAAMKLLGGDVGTVGDKVNSLGSKQQGLAILDSKIRQTKSEVKKLADEFVKTGDIDVFRKLGDAQGHLRGLEAVRKKLKDALVITPEESKGFFVGLISAAKALGVEFGKNFSAGLQGVLSNPIIGPALAIPLAAVIVAAMSFAGASIGGALLAGIGGAAAGGGLVGAWMGDPEKYSAKWDAATDRIKKRWIDSSRAFGNELDSVLEIADRTLRNLPVEKILALSQSFVTPLAEGVGQGIGGIASGFADALEHVQPIIDKLGPAIGNLGHDIGDAFRIISQGSEGGADALSDFVGAVGFVVKATATLILGFENAYESMRGFAIGANEVATTMPGVGVAILGAESYLFHIGSTSTQTARKLDSAGKSAHSTASGWGEMGKAAAGAAIDAIGLDDALTKLRNTQLAQVDAGLAVAQGWLDLGKELKDGAKSLDLNTQAGIDNRKAIVGQIELLEQKRQQDIKNGDGTQASIDKANAAYDAGIQKIREMAHAANFTDAQVDEMLRSYGLIPPAKTTQINTPGMSAALGQGIALGNALNRIDGNYTAHVDLTYTSHLPQGLSLGNLLHRAAGGPVKAGTPYVVGDGGRPEVFVPSADGLIVPSVSQFANMQQSRFADMRSSGQMGSGGGGRQDISVTLAITGNNRDWLTQAMQDAVYDQRVQFYVNGSRVQASRS
jgi:hypothetical protein